MNEVMLRTGGFLMVSCMTLAAALDPAVSRATPASEPTTQPSDAGDPRDQELSKRLIRQAATGRDADVMDQVTSLMSEAEDRLVGDLDPGPDTQTVQRNILERLDQAIQTALQQRSRASSRPVPGGERREMPKPSQEGPTGEPGDQGEAAQTGETTAEQSGAPTDAARGGPLQEVRRGWGHLPDRERDELLQAADDQFLERYRTQIEQYYRALSESEEHR